MRLWNLVLPPLQVITTVLCFSTGTSFEQASGTPAGDPPIIPAGYAFAIWTVIYAGCLAYGVFQYARAGTGDPLYRRIRPLTASAFAGTISWLLAARFQLIWLTVVCILWMLASLLPAFMEFMRYPASRFTSVERLCTVIPISIFTAWVTIATFANISAFLHGYGLLNVLLTPVAWAIVMLLIAGLIASWITMRSGSVTFAVTVCWALIAILVANLTREYNPSVALTAAFATLMVLATLSRSRRTGIFV